MNEINTIRVQLLDRHLTSAYDRLLSYSADYLMARPRAGFEDEWSETKQEIRTLEDWREEYPPVKEMQPKADPASGGGKPSPGDVYDSMIYDG